MKRAANDELKQARDAPAMPEDADIVRNGVMGEREFPGLEWLKPGGLCGTTCGPAERSYQQIRPEISSMCFTPDGMRLIVCDKNRNHPQILILYRDCKPSQQFPATTYPLVWPENVVMIDDTRIAVTGGGNNANVLLMDTSDTQVMHFLLHEGRYDSPQPLVVDHDGALISVNSLGIVHRLNTTTLKFEPRNQRLGNGYDSCHWTASRTMAYCNKNKIMYLLRKNYIQTAFQMTDNQISIGVLVQPRENQRPMSIACGPNGDIFVIWERGIEYVVECYDESGGMHRTIELPGLFNPTLAVDKFNHVWISGNKRMGLCFIKEYF